MMACGGSPISISSASPVATFVVDANSPPRCHTGTWGSPMTVASSNISRSPQVNLLPKAKHALYSPLWGFQSGQPVCVSITLPARVPAFLTLSPVASGAASPSKYSQNTSSRRSEHPIVNGDLSPTLYPKRSDENGAQVEDISASTPPAMNASSVSSAASQFHAVD
eukprot:gnl/MRDRNA2_/MRDRNA2_71875_c0_seq1.p1 gnl/MRDRNA2_/MRDRNA2_71875_c0~~gnl/MRDRNA2_/MRDRNA2_71875_c0_seq1.p1  ORF type:complete len:166 (-),score=13.47 gnl/MRDRNA2_/MRDRNA2_71875_c0_seq1:29-526(-)